MDSWVDLHCHSSASFDSGLKPDALFRSALAAGLTHVAITDHDTIDGALRLRDASPAGLEIIVGQEIRTTRGDVIGLFLERMIPGGLDVATTSQAIRAQGGLVGVPHPFDVYRHSVAIDLVTRSAQSGLAPLVDYVEVHNRRVRYAHASERAAEFAERFRLAGVAVSDAHDESDVGSCATVLTGPIGSAPDLRLALAGARRLVVRERPPGRGSMLERLSHRLGR